MKGPTSLRMPAAGCFDLEAVDLSSERFAMGHSSQASNVACPKAHDRVPGGQPAPSEAPRAVR